MNRQALMDAGIDYDEGVDRFAGNVAIYEKYLQKFFEGTQMDELEQQLLGSEGAAAFRTAHGIKGTAGNLSISRYYQTICALVELLRPDDKDYAAAIALLADAKRLYHQAYQAVKE